MINVPSFSLSRPPITSFIFTLPLAKGEGHWREGIAGEIWREGIAERVRREGIWKRIRWVEPLTWRRAPS
jgi:hypothetical protein